MILVIFIMAITIVSNGTYAKIGLTLKDDGNNLLSVEAVTLTTVIERQQQQQQQQRSGEQHCQKACLEKVSSFVTLDYIISHFINILYDIYLN